MNNHASTPDHLVSSADVMNTPEKLYETLRSFFPQTRKIYVNVNLLFHVQDIDQSDIRINLIRTDGHDGERQVRVITLQETDDRHPGSILVARFCREHPEILDAVLPTSAHYHTQSGYLGTLLIPGVRQSYNDGLISRTLSDNENLFRALFLDCIRNAQTQDPYPRIFCEIITYVARVCFLTRREHEIFVYHIFGNSYAQIGELLNISTSTVHNHVSAIHRKTHTRSIGDLHVKFFTPAGRCQSVRI